MSLTHAQRPRVVLFLDAVDGRNARMIQTGEDLRLPLEARKPIRIGRKRFRQDLQRHLPVQFGIGGLADLAHAALADEGGDIVVAEAGADVEGYTRFASGKRNPSAVSLLGVPRVCPKSVRSPCVFSQAAVLPTIATIGWP